MMTVAQLREALAMYPDSAEVFVAVDHHRSTILVGLKPSAVFHKGRVHLAQDRDRKRMAAQPIHNFRVL